MPLAVVPRLAPVIPWPVFVVPAALVRLLDTPEDERDRLVAGASLHQLQWSACLEPLKDILRQAMAPE